MKRLIILFLVLALAAAPVCVQAETVVTSFYPIWIFTLNLTEGIDGMEVRNLAAPGTGCLHDYQLQAGDMKVLATADVFLINGAGMESYLDTVFRTFSDLPVVTASEGLDFITEGNALQIGEEEEGETVNSHVWLDAGNAVTMVHNLANGLKTVYPQYTEQITANEDKYTARLAELDAELKSTLTTLKANGIVTFHEAFPYFAQAYGLNVLAVVNREPGEVLTPKEMSVLIATVRELGLPPLFVEPQYEDLNARLLAEETGAPVFMLDPMVTGPENDVPLDLYEQVMRSNRDTLLEALQ